MRTISVREPVARALLSFGAAAIGKNWPLDAVKPETMKKYLRPMGIHVSTQGSEKLMAPVRDLVVRHSLGEVKIGHPTPQGHVVASARLLEMIDARTRTRAALRDEIVRVLADQKLDVTPGWADGWIEIFPKVKWFWVFSEVQTCIPFRHRGVMSMFPVPDEVFGRK